MERAFFELRSIVSDGIHGDDPVCDYPQRYPTLLPPPESDRPSPASGGARDGLPADRG